jgi:hypothetical protein
MPDRAPLDDPAYIPEHPPINGIIPPIVARWGPKSQQRWFTRFWRDLAKQQEQSTRLFYCESEHHLGPCCYSCGEEAEYDMGVIMDGWCCCRDERAKR